MTAGRRPRSRFLGAAFFCVSPAAGPQYVAGQSAEPYLARLKHDQSPIRLLGLASAHVCVGVVHTVSPPWRCPTELPGASIPPMKSTGLANPGCLVSEEHLDTPAAGRKRRNNAQKWLYTILRLSPGGHSSGGSCSVCLNRCRDRATVGAGWLVA